ncbi:MULTISPECIES: plasmid replication initiator RepA [Pseudoalteromonas]|uniref:plasmid replication initiator RepA n=1 Tax=Pseudoalteromonas TaxID=53246 RepID=UPI0007337203|nr:MULTISPECIES: plasmid replication initiator RepA [Pseudoalteromonas]KTG22003.1 hypothetical protein AUR67_00555 [Pseudoalteromonas sp. XI10]TMP46672.1 hypothetical protein CWB80_09640 [Pseudoalteromonas sp. S1650]TMP68349.1 hypothetical protein CWB79_05925 [Pseudoalteromonas sp. S1649]|tara:strand:- start:3027 stop:3935 length:909 start_codon:yes stop_codon:yes gene_type:complete
MSQNNKNNGLLYCNRVQNPNPNYEVPKTHTTRLAFIRDLVVKCDQVNIVKSDEAVYMRPALSRNKIFYPDREKAMRALAKAFCEHVNLVTHQVQISLTNAANQCGLSTISQAEQEKAKADPTYNPKPSISRASRAFKDMIDLGWIVARKDWQVWDKDQGQWLDKYYEVTELFFKALGITPERVEKNRQNRLAYHKKKGGLLGLTVSQLGNMSLSEIKTWCRLSHYRRAFERLKDKREISKAKRRTLTKTPQQQRDIAQQVVIKRLGQDLNHTPIEVFKALVNQEVAKMRSQAGYSPPDTIAS